MTRIFLACAAALLLAGGASATESGLKPAQVFPVPKVTQAVVYLTAEGTNSLMAEGKPLSFAEDPQPYEDQSVVMVDPSRRYQTILGFGGAFTDSASEVFAKLPADKQQEVLAAYFSPTRGIGYTLGRTNINSCDFSSDTYSYDDVPGDVKLAHFSIAHDEKYKIPFIKRAREMAGGNLNLFASPWSPPAWMKSNNDMSHGGTLKPEDRQAWADYFVRFIQAYKKDGIPIWGLTIQNEPLSVQSWESCIVTAQDEHVFVRDFLGPTLHKDGLSDVKVMIWDHNRGLIYHRAQEIYSDPKAAKYVWGTAFHWYAGDHWSNVAPTHYAFPDKNLLFTEGSEGFIMSTPDHEWSGAERYGENILKDLSNWSVGWTDWNLILDSQGGPNHVGNFCAAPIMADAATGKLRYLPSYYYLGQFSKFIKPGARRIASTTTDDKLQDVAFINPDNSIAVVILNLTGDKRGTQVWMNDKAVTVGSPAHSIETVVMR